MLKELAVIILNWNGSVDTIECLDSLLANKQVYDIYLLDNSSESEDLANLEMYLPSSGFSYSIKSVNDFESEAFADELNLIKSDVNLGFAVGNNYVAQRICKMYSRVLLLNNDTIVMPNSISHMMNTFSQQNPIALTCDIRYNYDRQKLWNAGGKFKWYGDRKYFSQKKIDALIDKQKYYIQAEYITGCALMVCSDYIRQYGLFTDKFFHGEEDYNFCLNIKKRKLTVGVDLGARIYHKVGQSINRDKNAVKELRSIVVHYTNRVIDYKNFYGACRWRIWRSFYLFLIGIKRRISGMKGKRIKMIKQKVRYYSNHCNHVKRDVFLQIMNDSEIV